MRIQTTKNKRSLMKKIMMSMTTRRKVETAQRDPLLKKAMEEVQKVKLQESPKARQS